MDHRPHHRARRRHHANPLDPARSPWITSSTMSPRTAGTTCWSPHRKGRSCRCRSHHSVWHPHDEVIGFPVRRRVTTPTGLLPVHYSFSPTASPPPPPHPSSPRRTGHQLPNFNDQSSRRTHTSLPDEAARRTTRRQQGRKSPTLLSPSVHVAAGERRGAGLVRLRPR